MGLSQPETKGNFTFKLLSLQRPEIEELLSFLFRKLGYQVSEVHWEGDLLYLHLVKQEGILVHHLLACWTGGTRILSPDFLQSFLKTPPFTLSPDASFEKGFFLSPYEFHASFREEAQRRSIELINGQTLYDLLVEHQLTYYFPSFLEIAGRWLWRMAPVLIPGLLLMYGLFIYLTLKPERTAEISPSPGPSPTAEVSPGLSPPEASLVNPNFAVHIEEPVELYKRMDLVALAPPAAKTESVRRNEIPENLQPRLIPAYPERNPVRRPPEHTYSPRPAQRLHQPAPRHSSGGSKESAWHVINSHNKVVDLEEKYYSIAAQLEKDHYNAKAKAYYLKYLRIAPDGDYADAARAALKRLK